MRRLAKFACIALLICAVLLGVQSAQAQAAASAQAADQSLLAAAAKGDATAAGALLDTDFEWTTPVGISHKRSETLANLSALTTDVRGETGIQSYSYDHLVVLTATRPSSRFMRIWVQRPQGWRLFLMIDTAIVTGTAPPFSVPTSDQAPDCDNPCRNIPFNPTTPAQIEMLATFKRLKMDEWHPNPDDWAPYVLDDVYYVTSAAALSKADRVNRLAQQKQTGAASVPGDPVQFMRIVEFGQSAVMLARHAPFRGGKSYYSVRVWALRDGRWRFANSQQTTVESAAPIPAVRLRP
jgi:hypothetical protein